MFRNFLKADGGSVLVLFAIIVPVMSGATLYAVDYSMMVNARTTVQHAADAAALAASRQLGLGPNPSSPQEPDALLTAIARSVARANLAVDDDALGVKAYQEDMARVFVELTLDVETPLKLFLGDYEPVVRANATAELYGVRNICVIALQPDGGFPGVELVDSARIHGGDCGIYSNSSAPDSIRAFESAFIRAPYICSGGGFDGAASNFDGQMTSDCSPLTDPLKDRVLPVAPPCTHDTRVVFDGSGGGVEQLWPGHYCGGITIRGETQVEMQPGIYYIGTDTLEGALTALNGGAMASLSKAFFGAGGGGASDPDGNETRDSEACDDPALKATCGALVVMENSSLTGENVAIFAQGPFDHTAFLDQAHVSLSAPVTGDLAGILLVSRPVCPAGTNRCHPRKLLITSDSVRSLLGTIYLPEDNIEIDTDMGISEEAAFTIVVARQLFAKNTPTLVLNTDYESTTVPVPDGLSLKSGVRLRN